MCRGLVVAGILGAFLFGCRSADEGQGNAELVAEVESIQPGTPFMAGILFTLPEHWHTYWLNPGDSGMAPELKWQLPKGFTAGPILWPTPKRFDESSAASLGYEKEVLLLREIRPPADLVVGRDYTFEVTAAWLVCKDVCIPRTGRLPLALPALAEPPVASAKWQSLFTRAKHEVPVADSGWKFRALADNETVSLCVIPPADVAAGDLAKAEFFPAQPDLVEYGPQTWAKSKTEYCLSMKRISGGGPLPARLEGVFVVSKEKETKALDVNTALKE
jgi:DsbC/DsbD-like thiol-disulfide interchange protein